MRPVVGAKFGEYGLHVALDRVFRNEQVRRDDLICIPGSDLPQYFEFPFRKSVTCMMFCNCNGNLSGNAVLAGVYAANGIHEILPQSALQQVSAGSGIESLSGLYVTL